MHTNIIDTHPGLVIGFGIIVVVMLALDLGVFNRKSHEISSKEALAWSTVWISLAMLFSFVVYWIYNQDEGGHKIAIDKMTEFQTAYWIEEALSVDNLFVFILVFKSFKVPRAYQHKVLFWGILGAIVFRAIFIFVGVGLINMTYLPEMNIFGFNVRINVIMTLFGLFLLSAGIKSWGGHVDDEEQEDYGNSAGARLVKRFFKVSDNYDGDKFFTWQNGKRLATPLFIVLAVVEFTDLIFAVDSIPAIFAISDDPFILYTSNIFAIMGLRSLYFLLSNFMYMFSKLPYGLSIILAFIGLKMLISPFFHVPSPVSLGVVGGILLVSVILSLITRKDKAPEPEQEA